MNELTYVLIRTYSAGVFTGYLKAKDKDEVILLDATRIWFWSGACSLSQLAMEGTKDPENCKFAIPVHEITLFNVIEIIPVTDFAKESILNVNPWKIS